MISTLQVHEKLNLTSNIFSIRIKLEFCHYLPHKNCNIFSLVHIYIHFIYHFFWGRRGIFDVCGIIFDNCPIYLYRCSNFVQYFFFYAHQVSVFCDFGTFFRWEICRSFFPRCELWQNLNPAKIRHGFQLSLWKFGLNSQACKFNMKCKGLWFKRGKWFVFILWLRIIIKRTQTSTLFNVKCDTILFYLS